LSPLQLRRELNLYALLYESLLVSDSWLMTNAALQHILLGAGGEELLASGVLRPVRRDTEDSMASFFAGQMARPADQRMHGLCATDHFAAFVDQHSEDPDLTFSMDAVRSGYGEMSRRVLSPEVMTSFGVSDAGAELVDHMCREAGEGANTNTFVKDVVCPELLVVDAEYVMELARAPYSLNLPSVLGTGIIGPEGFRGDQIMAALRGEDVQSGGSVSIGDEGDFRAVITDPQVAWLFGDVLETLTVEEILAARSAFGRRTYLHSLQNYLASPSKLVWTNLSILLESFLREAAQKIFERRVRQGFITEDPADEWVDIEAGDAVRIALPRDPVAMSALAPGEKVQVVGRTYQVPTQPDVD